MINEVYANLVNLPPPDAYGPGEEYVPPGYVVKTLTPALALVSKLLFGSGADRFGRCHTAARVLAVALSRPGILEAVADPDARVALRGPQAVPVSSASGPYTARLDVPSPPFQATGRGGGRWTVVWNGTIAVVTPDGSGDTQVSPMVVSDGLRFGLPGSSATLTVSVVAGTWVVSVYAAPTHDWAQAADASPAAVFRPGASDIEDALYAAWRDGQTAFERAAAVGVGLARRTAEL